MNYTTITINGEKIGLKFGMASFRYLSEGKFVEGKSFANNQLTEIGIAHILYSGYYNNCIIKEIDPSLNFENFVDFVESNIIKQDGFSEIQKAVELWAASDFIKSEDNSKQEESKKKRIRGKK